MSIPWPPPGSKEAIDKGCACPVIDNCHGAGVVINDAAHYWVITDCPIHGTKAKETIKKKEKQ